MNSLNPLLKWPGGKSREINELDKSLPDFKSIDLYISPFFGGGALYFSKLPKKAVVNDIDIQLITFYKDIKNNSYKFFFTLDLILKDWEILTKISKNYLEVYEKKFIILKNSSGNNLLKNLKIQSKDLVDEVLQEDFSELVTPFFKEFQLITITYVSRKLKKTIELLSKSPNELEPRTHLINFETALKGSYYNLIRDFYYNINQDNYQKYQFSSFFFFIREFCFGSMFRYNSSGQFNIPYGGSNYNRKNLRRKINLIRSLNYNKLGLSIEFHSSNYLEFMSGLNKIITKESFVFYDPPYHSEFSSYSNNEFTTEDHKELAINFRNLNCKGMLVIKDTQFIRNLYDGKTTNFSGKKFYLHSFKKTYNYNVKGRNNRSVTHLVILNYNLNE